MILRPEAVSPVVGPALQPYSFNPRHRICFRHPHYRAPTNVLLDLIAPDSPAGALEYGFAHMACSVIAGNRWDGFFTHGVDGPPLQFAHGDIMPKGEYYFQIEGSTTENPYPIIPTFRDWPFPHNDLPLPYSEIVQPLSPISGRSYAPSNFSTAIVTQNITCRMSDLEEGTEAAHLCPRSELEWSRHNQMSIYNTSPNLPPDRILDDTANALLLRQDLHTQFDANKFVFMPKKGADASISIVTHLLTPSRELGMLHHNVQLKPILNVHPAFLLARFALSIFRFSEQFMAAGVDRNLFSADGEPKVVFGNDCKKLIARTRSQSPTKKSKRALPDDDEGGLDIEIRQRDHKRQRYAVDSPPGDTYAVTASEEDPQTPQTQPSQTGTLQEAWLKSERQRSDPENTWEQEQAWVKRVWDGKTPMGPQEAKRFHRFHGMDSQEVL